MDVSVRSDATKVLADQRRALARRPEAIRQVLRTAGRAYEREVVTRFMSGRGGKTAGLSNAALAGVAVRTNAGATSDQVRRATARARAREIGLARRALDTNPLTMGRALGLNRISKQAAAGWTVVATIEGDVIRLVVAQRMPYVRFHTDTYQPRGLPRRNPMRLPSGALWQERMTGPDLTSAIASAGFGARA